MSNSSQRRRKNIPAPEKDRSDGMGFSPSVHSAGPAAAECIQSICDSGAGRIFGSLTLLRPHLLLIRNRLHHFVFATRGLASFARNARSAASGNKVRGGNSRCVQEN